MAGGTNALIRLGLRSITAAFFFLAAGLLLSRFTATAEWPVASGVVESVAIYVAGEADDSRNPGEQFRLAVSYRYTVDGVEYTGDRIAVFPWIFRNRDRAAEYLSRHGIEPRRRISVYYNPDDAAQAILVRDIPWLRVEVLAAFLLLVILPAAVIGYSVVEYIRGGGRKKDDTSRGRFW